MDGGRLYYGLDARPPGLKLWVYTLQFLAFSVANSAVIPVLVGSALGLEGVAISTLVQRTFFFCAIGSLLQVWLGHGYPIFEGPAGIWYSVFIALGALAPGVGKSFATLRTDLELGLLVAGAVTVLCGATGLMAWVGPLFSPIVNGVFLIVMGFQLSGAIIKGAVGIIGEGELSGKAFVVSVVTVVTTVFFSLAGSRFLGSVGILFGVAVGWGLALLVGLKALAPWGPAGTIAVPELFAWGRPTFDAGIVLTCVLAGLIVLSNLVASLVGMAELTDTVADARRLNRGAVFTGISDLLGGLGAVVGFIPYASSLGLVAVSRVAARKPFVLSTLVLALLSFLPVVGNLFASLPPAIGYSVLLVTFSQVIAIGVASLSRSGFDARSNCIIGISLMVGVGVMFVPQSQLAALPDWARYLLYNGVIVGTFLSLFLDNLVPRAR